MFQRQQHDGKGSFFYRLYGVVVHGGRSLKAGHYTACVRMRTVDVIRARTFLQKTFLDRQLMMSKEQLIKLVSNDLPRERLAYTPPDEHSDLEEDQWFDISDTVVRPVNFREVYSKEAYLLFYERIQ